MTGPSPPPPPAQAVISGANANITTVDVASARHLKPTVISLSDSPGATCQG
jgi:hypothetical protein